MRFIYRIPLSIVKVLLSRRASSQDLALLSGLLIVVSFLTQTLFGQTSDVNSDLQAAAVAEKSGNYELAATLYQRLLDSANAEKNLPTWAHIRTRLGTAYYLLHRYEESLKAVAPLTRAPRPSIGISAQAWLVEGLDNLELNHPSEAIPTLRRALALNPESGTARLALGDAFAQIDHLEEARLEYDEQTKHTPSLAEGWYKLGIVYAQIATQVSRNFAQKYPTTQQLMAEQLLDKGDDLHAAGALFHLLRQASSQPQIHADLGTALLELGYAKAADSQFRQELIQNSESPLATSGLAETAALRGDWEEAIAKIELVAQSNPHELARLLKLPPAGPLREAWGAGKIQLPERLTASTGGKLWLAWFTNSEARPTPEKPNVSRQCSRLASQATTLPGIWLTEVCYERLVDRLKTKKPITLAERTKLAEAYFRLGHYQAARRQAELVLESNPRNEWAMSWLSQSNGELAEESFSKVASLSPESARAHDMLAHYYMGRHYFSRARTEYLAAIQLAPDQPDLHLGLGTLDVFSGDLEEAEKELQKTLELVPVSSLAHYELGDTYVQQHRWPLALDHLRRALADPSLTVKARLDLARADAEMGNTRHAIEDLTPILEQDPTGEVYYLLAGFYRKLGEKAQAQEALASFKKRRAASLEADRNELEALEKEGARSENSNNQKSPQ